MVRILVALTVAAAAMMPLSAFSSPPPQQLVEDSTTDLRYHQHNVDDTRYHLSHPLLHHNSEDPRRLLKDLTTDLLLVPGIRTDGNDLETVLCGSAHAPTWDDLLDLLEFCERFFEPGFAAVSRYSEGGDLSFTVDADAAVLLDVGQLAAAAHDWSHGWRQITDLDAFRITITSSDESLIATIKYNGDRWGLSFVHGSAARQEGDPRGSESP